MAKKVLWSMAGVAAGALIIMRVAGFPPVENGTEATIGAAQRYQAQQVSNADVKVQDAQLQAFLQTDAFHKLSTDKAALAALRNKDFQRALTDSSVRVALANGDIQVALARYGATAATAAKLEASAATALTRALQSSQALQVALSSPAVAQAIAYSSLAQVLASSDAVVLSQAEAVNVVLSATAAGWDATAVSPGAKSD